MNKLLLMCIGLFSVSVFSASSFGLNYNTWDIDGTTVDGPGLTFTGANGNFVYDVDIFELEAGGASLTANVMELGYAIGDASEGAVFVGFQTADSDLNGVSRETDGQVGWVKRGDDGTQIKISVVADEDNSILGDFQFPMGSGFIELGFWSNDGDTLFRLGYSWKL